ncbi:MAG: hypothetical protein WCJ56_02305 [bacterium]
MSIIAETGASRQPPNDLIDRICTSPAGQLAICRAESLLQVIQGYPVVLRRFYQSPKTGQEQTATHRIFPADIPAALLTMLHGDASWLPAGMIRVYGTSQERERIFLQRLDPSSQRLCVIPEYAPAQRTRCIAYDFDGPNHSNPLKDALGSAVATYKHFTGLGLPAYLVRSHSGQGYHLWVFLETEIESRIARHLATHLLADAIDDANERAKVEINPKWHLPGSQGASLTLPWHAGAEPGHNTLIDPSTGEPLALPPGGVFARVRYTQLNEMMLRLPPIPSEDEERQGHQARQQRGTAPDNEFSSWAQQVCGNEALIHQVYGHYLTGRTVQGRYLECRDPASPTGDRTPSARVNPDTGSFRSFRSAGRKASIFQMMVELGQAQNTAAAMRKAEQLTGHKLASTRIGNYAPYGQRMVPYDDIEPPTLTQLPLKDAWAHMEEIVQQQIVPLVQRHGQSVNLIRGGTGVGKSKQFGELFAAIAKSLLLDNDKEPLRALYATHSRAKIDELVRDYLTGADGALLPGVVIAYPRSPDPVAPGFCRRYKQAEALTKCNQSVNALLCKACQKDMKAKVKAKWEAMSPWERRKEPLKTLLTPCPYQENSKQLEDARVVVGVRHSFQHGGKLLEDFNLIVIDEQAEEAFFQTTHFPAAALSVWEHRMAKKQDTADVLFPVLSTMKQALVAGPAEGFTHIKHAIPLLPVLQQLDPEIGTKLYALHEHLQEIIREGHAPGMPEQAIMGTFIDLPTSDEVWEGKEAIPMRGLSTLVETLRAEVMAGHAVPETQVWIRLPYGNDPGGIFTVQPRTHLINSLEKRVTVFLDATAYVPIMDRLFNGKITVYPIPVQPNMQVNFFGDTLYRWQDLQKSQWRWEALQHDIQRKCARFKHVLVIGESAAEETIAKMLPPHVELEHWFSGEMAGSNRYEDCDAMICIGHPREPVDELVYRLAALRWPDALAGGLPDDRPDLFATEEIIAPVAGFQDTKGRRWGRIIPYPADPDLQHYARHRYATTITQAVGRIRPASPGTPKQVFLYIGEPAQEMPVARLMTLERSMAEEDPDYLRTHPYRRKCGQQESIPQLPKPDRKGASFVKYLQAAEGLRTQGKTITIYALQQAVGGSTRTAAHYHARVLETLAIRNCKRQAMEAELSSIVDPEYAGAWANLAYQCAEDAFPLIVPYLEHLSPAAWEKHWLRTAYYPAYFRGTRPHNAANFARAKFVFAEDEESFRHWADQHQEMWEHTIPADPEVDALPEMTVQEWISLSFETWWASLSPEMAAAVVAEKMALF